MSVSTNFPAIRPSLLLDFANTGSLDPRVTFTRSTTATYYDGVTTAKAEQNLLTYSQDFDNAAWGKAGSTVTANTIVAPDGTTTADDVLADSGAASLGHGIWRDMTLGSGYVLTVFVKKGTNDFFQICSDSADSRYANFDVASGVLGTTGAGFINESIDSIGNGWYRCKVEFNFSEASNRIRFLIVSSSSAAWRENFSATGTETIYLWGAQLEQRSSVTAYTATTTQPITNYIPVLQTAAANVARFDHNPTTGEALGLLIEEQRTNLLTYSAQFDNAAWGKSNATVTANTVVAPDGTLAGDKLIASAVSSGHWLYFGLGTTSGTHTWSVYAKAGEYSWIGINAYVGGNNLTSFNLSTGVVGTNAAGNTATITPVGNGWYRCTVARTGGASTYIELRIGNADNSFTFTGDGYSGIFIWGAQLEAGAFPTSYIATTTAATTRTADFAQMTGINFTSWYNNEEGTLYSEGAPPITTSTGRLASISTSASSSTQVYCQTFDAANIRIYQTSAAGLVYNLYPLSSYSAKTFYRVISAYQNGNNAASVAAGTVATDSSAQPFGVMQSLTIGSLADQAFFMNGPIKKIAYYPQRLTNAQLQGLTS